MHKEELNFARKDNTMVARYLPSNSHDELYHHGVKGQKWGVRRYQNADGTLTDAGKKDIIILILKDLNH